MFECYILFHFCYKSSTLFQNWMFCYKMWSL